MPDKKLKKKLSIHITKYGSADSKAFFVLHQQKKKKKKMKKKINQYKMKQVYKNEYDMNKINTHSRNSDFNILITVLFHSLF